MSEYPDVAEILQHVAARLLGANSTEADKARTYRQRIVPYVFRTVADRPEAATRAEPSIFYIPEHWNYFAGPKELRRNRIAT